MCMSLLILCVGGTVSQNRCLYLCDKWKEVLELLQLSKIHPEPYVCSIGTVLERTPNLTLKETQL